MQARTQREWMDWYFTLILQHRRLLEGFWTHKWIVFALQRECRLYLYHKRIWENRIKKEMKK